MPPETTRVSPPVSPSSPRERVVEGAGARSPERRRWRTPSGLPGERPPGPPPRIFNVPVHRQRSPASARRTSASVGVAFSASRCARGQEDAWGTESRTGPRPGARRSWRASGLARGAGIAESLHRGRSWRPSSRAASVRRWPRTGAPVEEHGAGAAHSFSTPVLRAVESEAIAEEIHDGPVIRRPARHGRPVQGERERVMPRSRWRGRTRVANSPASSAALTFITRVPTGAVKPGAPSPPAPVMHDRRVRRRAGTDLLEVERTP